MVTKAMRLLPSRTGGPVARPLSQAAAGSARSEPARRSPAQAPPSSSADARLVSEQTAEVVVAVAALPELRKQMRGEVG